MPGAAGQAHLQPVPAPGGDPASRGSTSAVWTACCRSTRAARTADVQGMCTYEELVDATLPHGLMPLVVPQLRTITLGGAVTGLGIESTSFRNGLPHESVLEMDVLHGRRRDHHRPTGRRARRPVRRVPQLLGSLGYATRLRIELEPVAPVRGVAPRAVRRPRALAKTVAEIVETRTWEGEQVDGLDGVVFAPAEAYLTLARCTDGRPRPATTPVSRSTTDRPAARDRRAHAYDYLWRWDTDWFWCSGAFGAQRPRMRRLWPARYRRSDVYYRLVGLEHPVQQDAARIDRTRQSARARARGPDMEMPGGPTADFLAWFDGAVGMSPVWLCPLRLREPEGPESARTWPSYPLRAGAAASTSGSGGACSRTRCGRGRHQPRDGGGGRSSAGTSRCTPRRTTTGTRRSALRRGQRPGRAAVRPRGAGSSTLYEKAVTSR